MTHAPAVKAFIIEEFLPDVPAGELADDHDLLENGIVDSLGLLKVIAWLEDRYGIDADTVDLDPESFTTVTAIAAFIEQSAPKTAGAA
ncbi:acyl carrier protein [Streptomyces sp. NPDC059851]|uniref:acyl carrier protein n=1 Tax=Streptomyces sp. NPDC059851 TaxID=3346971 RepID=UPI00365ED92F